MIIGAVWYFPFELAAKSARVGVFVRPTPPPVLNGLNEWVAEGGTSDINHFQPPLNYQRSIVLKKDVPK